LGLGYRRVAASWLVNAGLVGLMKAPACDPGWFVCENLPRMYPLIRWEGNQQVLEKARAWLEAALELRKDTAFILLRLAEVNFSLEDRRQAAALIEKAGILDASQGPLSQESRYETQLVQANREMAQQNWQEAVNHYRLGLSWGDERVLESDQADYLRSLAALYQTQLNPVALSDEKIYWIGRLLAEAGDWTQAESWLARLDGQSSLLTQQKALRMETLGRIAEQEGDLAKAVEAYQQAFELNPGLHSAGLRLLGLLWQMGEVEQAETMERSLRVSGPTFYLGEQGEGYLVQEKVSLPGGWTLVGYDLDEEMLEQTHFLDLWLWWRKDGEKPLGSEWTQVGEWWVQRQRVVNLFPNAGFEWGMDERGVPWGHDREFYRAPEGSLYIIPKVKDGRITQALVTHNTDQVNHVALASRMIPVDPSANYLMGGWIWDSIGLSTIGRGCKGQQFFAVSPYYIAYFQLDRPKSTWIHHAEVSAAHPGTKPQFCESLVMNDANANEPAAWDDLLWVKIESPE
jgi:tetratricopeptide (TPR) repeat protein